MREGYIVMLLFAIILSSSNLSAQNAKPRTTKPPPKIKSAVFSGIWKGGEKCSEVSAPVAILTIVTNGPSAVTVSGIYSISGKIKGSIKGNQVVIELQEVHDPNFQNMAISGTLTLSVDRKSLIASFTVQNNNTRDECTATYLKTNL